MNLNSIENLKQCRATLATALQSAFWTAPAERSGDGAFATKTIHSS
ncbi:MAG TPA: hypothetical protein VGO68_16900 [Pyrinomonadaceae bacterium]|nr:hypothetical protein [Pyrinomonadaceae bacterium]